MRLLWATDIHLNFLETWEREDFYQQLRSHHPDAVLLTGDLTEAPHLRDHLLELAHTVACPVYFVLGNHDFYRGSVAATRSIAEALQQEDPRLHYLPAHGSVQLTSSCTLLGCDGWGDLRAGEPDRSVELNDDVWIEDLRSLPRKQERKALLQKLADDDAKKLQSDLRSVLSRSQQVLVATHVPPFAESCWHEGAMSGPEWLPRFTCVAVGTVLHEELSQHPTRNALVFCGHTHSSGVVKRLGNLEIRTGGADYGAPTLAGVLDL